MTQCAVAIARHQYKEALRILIKGLEDKIQSENQIDYRDLLTRFYALVIALESDLVSEYGDSWQDEIEIPHKLEKEIRCSFCGKSQREVSKIIAGPTAYICNECISICNEILEDDH